MDTPRGEHVLEATLRVIAEHGLAGLGVRPVATEARVSPAQVQYYFRTKRELVRAGFEHAGRQFLAELDRLPAGEPSPARLREMIELWLPLDTERERRARVWLAYAATAAIDRELAAEAAEADTELRALLAAELSGMDCADPELVAAQLFALVDGLTVQALALPPARRRELTDRTLTPFLDALAVPR